MKQRHNKPSNIPKTALTYGQQAAKNIASARERMLADTLADVDLTNSAERLRASISAGCRQSHPEWVTTFATGKVPSKNPLSDNTIALLKVLEQELEDGKVNIETLNKLDEMLSY